MKDNILIYEGNSKQVFATENVNEVIVYYTDEMTAFDGIKKATIPSKGIVNNRISGIIYQHLKQINVPNHFIKSLTDREQLCHKVKIIPIRFIIRNIITGSIVKRLKMVDGMVLDNPLFELYYKDDKLGNPLINDNHVFALDLCNARELSLMYQYSKVINESLKSLFNKAGIILVDLNLEFGRDANGEIVLADEITPDTCRFWDQLTGDSLDKDRFRQDSGNVIEGYVEVLERLEVYDKN